MSASLSTHESEERPEEESEERPEEESQEQVAPHLLDERDASLQGNILITYITLHLTDATDYESEDNGHNTNNDNGEDVSVDIIQPMHQPEPPQFGRGNYSSFLTQMNGEGYYVVKNIMNLDESMPSTWIRKSKKWKRVFGRKRYQSTHQNSVVDKSVIKPLLDESKKQLEHFFTTLFYGETALTFSLETAVLWSKPDCPRQQWHFDYRSYNKGTKRQLSPINLFELSDKLTAVPLIGLLGLMENTTIDVVPYSYKFFAYDLPKNSNFKGTHKPIQLKIGKGDIIIMRGDILHAGSAYTDNHYRIHYYLDFQGSPFPVHDSRDTNYLTHQNYIKFLDEKVQHY